ncbi:nicotinate phosphoribosyltransferase [Bowdeniella nasicola]|uniref:Nicotinate phosphoribosyltransferase n=1 Tax=Bowdeniella nasicola TaxID=208480 RepID=A0A1Q5Q3G0_9ACTO|nr:nicotinate phosphoribosyltransferase [Bowdeniella nasicola]OKL54363.1 nicotinate phosphoribosyltransferase [Bowdeniella nasicola]
MSLRSSTALLTDMYELTMIDAALASGHAMRPAVFELFGRRLPAARRYGVVAGIARVLDAVEAFRFSDDELTYLRSLDTLSDETIDYLASYRFSGDITGYAEGECYFPGSPLLTVTAPFAEGVVLETVLLSILNHDCAVASAASRMTSAAHGRPCLEMGARRTHEEGAVAAARAAVVAGFAGSSILEAGRSYGIHTIGTAAHSFTLLYDSEDEAFDAQIARLGTGTTLLVDTYDTPRGVERAVAAARRVGGKLGAVRLDSGDLIAQAFTVRQQLDDLGAHDTKITVTSDLDEYAIAALGAAPVDSYGVGTKVVTGSGHPTAELVYKLVARQGDDGQWAPVAKKSSSKTSIGGRKFAGRVVAEGHAAVELVVATNDEDAALRYFASRGARPLQVPLVTNGEINEEHRGDGSLEAARERHEASRAELPYQAWRLSEGEVAIPTVMEEL